MKLINMEEIQVEQVSWLWKPYIPYGKITLIQGDPGDGKTSFILAVAARLTNGQAMPESEEAHIPSSVIYQTAEDGLADTIKPRLVQAGADCSKVVVIDESEQLLTLSDVRIERAIVQINAKMLILDPLQAYLGVDVDMHRANEIRPVFKALAGVAERTGCAVVIVGHMNKMSGAKGLYRGLGSIDITAAARSVLVIGRVKDERVMAHLKSSLAMEGRSIAFRLNADSGFEWLGYCEIGIEDLLESKGQAEIRSTKHMEAEKLLAELLQEKPLACSEIYDLFAQREISRRTVENAKRALNIRSFKRGTNWYWEMKEGADRGNPRPKATTQQDKVFKENSIKTAAIQNGEQLNFL